MFNGTSDNFTLCIKEKENIPNIFEELKKINATRDCSSICYGDNKERFSIPNKGLCCPFYEYNGECYDKCPRKTREIVNNTHCQPFTCS